MADKNMNYKVYENEEIGNVFIADHVVENIAAIAALEVAGVSSRWDVKKSRRLVEKNLNKILPKRMKVQIDGDNIHVRMFITVAFGYNVLTVCKNVQNKVKNSIQNMTGMNVSAVNVHVVNIEEPEQA
ncbi:MAG: Asp23/Gls24 family envelope stress response protein [Eubacteriales bacterium]|nr:Asp23/Gls24 family envelope stress response protein [Eubacteriales bacterium]